jgi:hypothetical protein
VRRKIIACSTSASTSRTLPRQGYCSSRLSASRVAPRTEKPYRSLSWTRKCSTMGIDSPGPDPSRPYVQMAIRVSMEWLAVGAYRLAAMFGEMYGR